MGRDTSGRHPHRIEPGPGQESVWDYPRPPVVVDSAAHVRVVHRGVTVADTRRARRVLETSQPPAWYLPPDDVRTDLLVASRTRSVCEWKGVAAYWTLRLPADPATGAPAVEVPDVAWSYPSATGRFAPIAGWIAVYAQKVDACFVDDEQVQPNPGSFYGGWITSAVVGPFKGGPGTAGW